MLFLRSLVYIVLGFLIEFSCLYIFHKSIMFHKYFVAMKYRSPYGYVIFLV